MLDATCRVENRLSTREAQMKYRSLASVQEMQAVTASGRTRCSAAPLAFRHNRLDRLERTLTQVIRAARRGVREGIHPRCDATEVVRDRVAFWRPLAEDQERSLTVEVPQGPVWVHGHTEALFRAVRNLVENAIRHTPAGVSVEVDVTEDGIVRVLDDGPGVPATDRESIFRRFWRRDRGKADSRGLGLAIVARVAEAHDGSV